jgi:hypothetical protein
LLYRSLGRLDGACGVASWEEALAWLTSYRPSEPIAEIQYWGHGRWGRILVDSESFDEQALQPSHRHAVKLDALRERLLTDGRALVWLRTCESFGATRGLAFAQRLSERLQARVAGHTHVIGAVQSGLHGLRLGATPDWEPSEGIAEGTADDPRRAHGSSIHRTRTITCLDGEVPSAWFA